ncbi:MAG: excinuclease ABC subunit UvrC [Silvanigrellales bacterium]|nr:excinuclease ABC subunit UvrC [Silvanigrellales bacterium]
MRSKLGLVPQSPGVYIHKDDQGKILYVGKARNLQNRLRSYFTGLERHAPKTRALVSKITDFEVMVVGNENESLLLENNLIKHNKPPYNILLRDDKTYPYLKLDLADPWPRLVHTRRRRNDGALYFGPYASSAELQKVLGVIQRFFPLVKCPPSQFRTVTRPCNYYDIKRCLGPCKLPVERATYLEHVDKVVAILRGRTREVIERLRKEMSVAAEVTEFEKAAALRDQIRALENLSDKRAVSLQPGFHADVTCVYMHAEKVSFYTSIVRDGKLVGGENHVVDATVEVPDDGNDVRESGDARSASHISRAEMLSQYLGQFYSRREVPDHVCLPDARGLFSPEEIGALEHFFGEMKKQRGGGDASRTRLHAGRELPDARASGSKGEALRILRDGYEGLLETCEENARNRLLENIRIDEKSQAMLTGLQKFLGLEKLPSWLECYDISTFQGAETVASGVVFREGKPSKSEYRRYIVKEVLKQDDFASLREVIRRRFKEERRHETPDVLFVDGGEPQVREVGYVLQSLGLDNVCLFGIAKSRTESAFRQTAVKASSERVVIPMRENGLLRPEAQPQTRILTPGSPEFRLVTQLRDEAHRFAITFHRSRRDKTSQKSILQTIKGLGPKGRRALIDAFGSVSGVRAATPEDLVAKAGLKASVAEAVLAALVKPE